MMLRNQSNNVTFMHCTSPRRDDGTTNTYREPPPASKIQMEAWKLHLVSARRGKTASPVLYKYSRCCSASSCTSHMFHGGDHKNQPLLCRGRSFASEVGLNWKLAFWSPRLQAAGIGCTSADAAIGWVGHLFQAPFAQHSYVNKRGPVGA